MQVDDHLHAPSMICVFNREQTENIHSQGQQFSSKYVFYCIGWKPQDFQSLHSNGRKSEEKMKWSLNNKTKMIGYLIYWIEG